MLKYKTNSWLVVIIFIFFLQPNTIAAQRNNFTKKQLKQKLTQAILTVRLDTTVNYRADGAEELARLTNGIDPNKVDDTTLLDMILLLNTSEDSVRYWVAASLGQLGPRAKAAAPKLLELMPMSDCLLGSLTSAPAIRYALERIGITPPPPAPCKTHGYGTIVELPPINP